MADVFEEEEDEEGADQAATSLSKDKTPVANLQKSETPNPTLEPKMDMEIEPTVVEDETKVGIQMVESDSAVGNTITWNFDDGLGIKDSSRQRKRSFGFDQPQSPMTSVADLSNEPVEVVEDYEEPRASSLTRSSDSTVTPSVEEGKESQPPISLPVPLPQQPLMTPETYVSSTFTSPDFRYRQNSWDTPRIGTAASSITDRGTLNSMVGEPGPELRISVDDVPSLTSSRSTATGGHHNYPLPMISPRHTGERASSLSSTHSISSDRRRKRSSIASLSRLLGSSGSFGERSKLNIEQRPQSEHLEPGHRAKLKEKEKKKTHRLSKMMHFWGRKDKKESKA
jgi:hypothetical protein